MNESRRAVDFGRYRLLPDQRLLIEGETPVPLGGRAFDILMALVERRSEVVSKDELMHRVWGGQVVEENTLAVHLSALRKALGDGKEGIRYIGTVPGRGYQFVAPVEAIREPEEPETAGTAADKATGNLPRATGPLIGRDAALAAVVSALDAAPLVTLSGPGGIGKTRLALAVAAGVAKHYRDGVWWADLTSIGDPTLVVGTVAQALDIQLGNAPPLPRLMSGLKGRQLLLVLDNCEHVAAAVAELCVAMREHAEIRLLATSQEPLGVAGEQVERLGPLDLPDAAPMMEITASEALATPAVQLFAERARLIEPRFTIDDGSVGAVIAMCRQLDGVPLALELAAARAALLGVEPVATRLDRQLLELSGGRRDVLPKHQTLRALLDWSHGLLSPAERIVLRRLAIFAGGCTLEAAEAVAADDEVPDWEVADHLTSLIGKSLVIAERAAQGARYRLLETTRVYAAEQLVASGEQTATALRHARYFAQLFEASDKAYQHLPELEWLPVHTPELDNLRAALNFALADPEHAPIGIGLAASGALLFDSLGLIAELRSYTERAMAAVTQDTPHMLVATLTAKMAIIQGNFDRPRALELAEQAAAMFLQLGNREKRASALITVGAMQTMFGQHDAAGVALHEAYETLRHADRPKSLMFVSVVLGNLYGASNRPAEAVPWYRRTIDLARLLKHVSFEALALANLAEAEFLLGEVDRAIEVGMEAIDRFRQLGRREYLAPSLVNLATYLLFRDEVAAARPIGMEAFAILRESGGSYLLHCLEVWALLAASEGRYEAAAQLAGFTDAALARSGENREPVLQQVQCRLADRLAANLAPARVASHRAEGAEWTEEQAAGFVAANLAAQA